MIGFGWRERRMVSYPESLDDLPPPPRRRGWWRHVSAASAGPLRRVLMAMLVVVVLWPYVVINGAERPGRRPVEALQRL